MEIKDALVRLYVKNYILPRALIFDKPGFVDFKISGKTEVFARQFLVPEMMFVELERRLIDKFGLAGAQKLYSLGKRFGYSFARLGHFENIKDHPGEAVRDWVLIATKFIEGTYASNIYQTIDTRAKSVDFNLVNFAVAEKLEHEYFLSTGGAAGLMAWIFQEPTIEAWQYARQTNGEDQISKVFCAPHSDLQSKFPESKKFVETDLLELEQDPRAYLNFNQEVDFAGMKSFKAYLDSGLFGYSRGKIVNGGERFFLMEATALYLLETGLEGDMKSILAESAFTTGKQLLSRVCNKNPQALSEILTALGWGRVAISGSDNTLQITIEHYPWTKYYDKSDFTIVSNLLAGALSAIHDTPVSLKISAKEVSEQQFNLLLEE